MPMPETQSTLSDSTGDFTIQAPRPRRARVTFGAATHPGKVRANNEDQFLVSRLAKSMHICKTSLAGDGKTFFSEEEGYMMVVADGMGGAAAGERASALAVESVERFVLNTFKWFLHLGGKEENTLYAELREGLERADRAVLSLARSEPGLHGMGTTLTMAYSVGPDLYVVHAGDSRAYLFREGELHQLTSDHTLVQVLVQGGAITPEAAKHHKMRNIVTNVIGGPREGVHAEIHKLIVDDGDTLLICSDGLTEPVPDAMIAEILAANPDPEDACAQLIARALERGGPDNVTAIVARYRLGNDE